MRRIQDPLRSGSSFTLYRKWVSVKLLPRREGLIRNYHYYLPFSNAVGARVSLLGSLGTDMKPNDYIKF